MSLWGQLATVYLAEMVHSESVSSISLINRRNPSLTAPESGKSAATSGSSWIVGVERLRPGPRATTGSRVKSYSGRKSSSISEV
jgi:hypothetical protein